MTGVDLDALDKLRGALRRDADFWMQADRIADALLPVVDRIANERAAAELRAAADIPLKACCPEHASKRLRYRAAALGAK